MPPQTTHLPMSVVNMSSLHFGQRPANALVANRISTTRRNQLQDFVGSASHGVKSFHSKTIHTHSGATCVKRSLRAEDAKCQNEPKLNANVEISISYETSWRRWHGRRIFSI